MKEVKLPSGAVLKIGLSPFAVSKALYQAILEDARGIVITSAMEMANVYKDVFCAALSSPRIERCLQECLKRCTYNDGKGDLKIDENTFESVAARGDYITVCTEVAVENVLPFAKNLSAVLQHMLSMTESVQALR